MGFVIAKDGPVMAEFPSSCVMYIKVTDVDGIIEKGEPGGNVIGFAEMATADV